MPKSLLENAVKQARIENIEHVNHKEKHVEAKHIGTMCRSPSLGEAAKRAAAAELMVHKRRSKKFFNAMQDTINECRENKDIATCFDFMKNVHLPEVPVQDLFYLSQLK
ncbi:hypothetical protein ILUMI_25571 [Ignelater luminosus]|uniref:Uncharacterized protein n=1 Tax=Ignelater luminosus TaxID=2038154 RepID=A0A8K0C887_IGNLU|nr:hypothetical protein ILUMI_25571 [Ignelater luminosus]